MCHRLNEGVLTHNDEGTFVFSDQNSIGHIFAAFGISDLYFCCAIFGDEMVQSGEVQVYFPDDSVGGEFDELIAIAENGGDFANNPAFQRVKEALRKGHVTNSKKLIKPCGKNGALLNWYNTCEGIRLVYHDIDPYA